jgi:ankyrin repeat protein
LWYNEGDMRNAAYILAILLLLLPACERHDSTIPGDIDSEKTAVPEKDRNITTDQSKAVETEQDLNQDIFKAVQLGNVEAVRLYLGRGGDPDGRKKKKSQMYALIHIAAKNGRTDILEALLANGADINSTISSRTFFAGGLGDTDKSNQTPLHVAVEHADYKTVEFLVNKGADVKAKDQYGRMPLQLLALTGIETKEKGECLINNGAKLDTPGAPFGRTPLLAAAGKNNCEAAELLLENGADIYATDRFGKTALDIAFEQYYVPMIMLLHKHGVPTKRKLRILAEAVLLEDIEKVKDMLEKGCWVDESFSYFQYAPLHIASLYGNTEIAKLLIKGKADVNRRDWKKLTPLDFAKTEEMKKLLRSHGAVSGKELKEK